MFWRSCLFLIGVGMAFGVPAEEAAKSTTESRFHLGMCDASAAVALDEKTFAVASDEDNIIRLYRHAEVRGKPLAYVDLSRFLKVQKKSPESDIEGAAWVGKQIFWITSHGRNKNAKFRESRHRIFAMEIKGQGTWTPDSTGLSGKYLVPVGKPYTRLLGDLIADARLKSYRLLAASELAPKDRGALNIEGLAATPEGHLLIGFRNPVPLGEALVVPLLNPAEIIEGKRARLGRPIHLKLGGLGIRAMARHGSGYLIAAGAYDGRDVSRIYYWNGTQSNPRPIGDRIFTSFNPETLVVYPGISGRFQVISDDGTRNINGQDCKDLVDVNSRQFRSLWMTWP